MCATERSPEDIFKQVSGRFGIDVNPDGIEFIRMPNNWAKLLETKTWPKFTVLGQSLGCMFLALRMFSYFLRCEIICETTGLAFAYPVARLARAFSNFSIFGAMTAWQYGALPLRA